MSSFLCDAGTFDRLACAIDRVASDDSTQLWHMHYALRGYSTLFLQAEIDTQRTDAVLAYKLHGLNNKALDARYGDAPTWDYGYVFESRPTILAKQKHQLLKTINCVLYQCAEGNDPDEPLFKLLESARDGLSRDIAEGSEEYEKARWG